MNNLDDVNVQLARTGYVKKVNIEKRLAYNLYYLDIEILLSCDADFSKDFVTLKFYNVKELTMENLNPILAIQFSIYDKSNCQLENTRFYVCDEEHDTFSFYCEKISFNGEFVFL